MRTLSAPLCILEPQTVAHAHEMFAVLSDPAIYEFENAPPKSEEWLRDRYARLERRSCPDRTELWLNWEVRVPGGGLAGYVQATVLRGGSAYIAYELASGFWGRGLGFSAVQAVLDELTSRYDVRTCLAVLKARNHRSLALLRRLAFSPASQAQAAACNPEPDELVMCRHAAYANMLGPR